MEWQAFPESGTLLPGGNRYTAGTLLPGVNRYTAGTVVNGFVCWVQMGCVLALDTATFQFSWINLPPALKEHESFSKLGQTKDGGGRRRKLTMKVSRGLRCTGCFHCTQASRRSLGIQIQRIKLQTNGCGLWRSSMDLCTYLLPTAGNHDLLSGSCPSAWKQNSETGVIGEIFEDDGPTGTEEASPVLFTALQSFKEALIDDDNVNFTTIGAFLLDDEKNSLQNKITTLESRLATARDRALRIGSGFNNREGMERGSWWQMRDGRLGRDYSQFLLLIVAFSIGIMMGFLLY